MRQLTKKEKEIMEFFWDRGPMFIRELQGCYGKEPNFSTLSTQVHTLQVDGFRTARHLAATIVIFLSLVPMNTATAAYTAS